MPPKKQRRQPLPLLSDNSVFNTSMPNSPTNSLHRKPSSTHRHEMSLKDMMSTIPPYSTPTRVWVEKIKLMWPESDSSPRQLMDIIKLRLPARLFENVSGITFASHIPLLEKVCLLDGPTTEQAAQSILESGGQIKPDMSAREHFTELKRLAQIAFPQLNADQTTEIAWTKLSRAMSPSIRQILALLPQTSSYSEEALEAFDRALKLPTISNVVTCVTSPAVTSSNTLSALESRMKALEDNLKSEISTINAALVHRANERSRQSYAPQLDICWYHFKFGSSARRCSPPCRHFSTFSGNAKGAPTPKYGPNRY